MKLTKSILLFTLVSVVMASNAFALGDEKLTSIYWSVAKADGDFEKFIDQTSLRGFGLQGRWFVKSALSVGLVWEWQVFDQETDDLINTTLGDNGLNATISGKQFRYTNAFPILATAHLYLGTAGATRIFVGGGAGAYYMIDRLEIGLVALEEKNWRFGVAPEAGLLLPVGDIYGHQHIILATGTKTHTHATARERKRHRSLEPNGNLFARVHLCTETQDYRELPLIRNAGLIDRIPSPAERELSVRHYLTVLRSLERADLPVLDVYGSRPWYVRRDPCPIELEIRVLTRPQQDELHTRPNIDINLNAIEARALNIGVGPSIDRVKILAHRPYITTEQTDFGFVALLLKRKALPLALRRGAGNPTHEDNGQNN